MVCTENSHFLGLITGTSNVKYDMLHLSSKKSAILKVELIFFLTHCINFSLSKFLLVCKTPLSDEQTNSLNNFLLSLSPHSYTYCFDRDFECSHQTESMLRKSGSFF